ncbi:DUF1800 family protein [Candidatus Kapabacteria bacterium]|nr:DUF1800 family protein [Candidatus Kapabacteria bacterium]
MERRELISSNSIREFFNEIFIDHKNVEFTSSLSPKSGTLDRRNALHLLRRISFQPTIKELEYFDGMEITEAVNLLLGDGNDDLPENASRLPNPDDYSETKSWYQNAIQSPSSAGALELKFELEGILKSRFRKTQDWIIRLAKEEDLTENPAREKLTYFLNSIWNIEFTYDTRSFNPPNLLLKNNNTLRKLRLGSYKDIAKEMTLDGAFLLYQSLQLSNKEAPNENFARELLELFTMGIGNYTEGNIKEASRILTGWRTAPFFNSKKPNGEFSTWFDPGAHDKTSKQFMGSIFSGINESENNEFKVRDNEVYKLIDVIFDVGRDAIAKFIATKIVKFFVYANEKDIDSNLVNSTSQSLIDNDFNLRSVYFELFTSEEFFDSKYYGVQYKSPFELIVGTSRSFDLSLETTEERNTMYNMEQVLYDPPDVSGWEQYRTWISTTTYPYRNSYLWGLVNKFDNQSIQQFIKDVPQWENPDLFFRYLFDYLTPINFIDERETYVVDGIVFNNTSNSNMTKANWQNLVDSSDPEILDRVKSAISVIIVSPDFQLT